MKKPWRSFQGLWVLQNENSWGYFKPWIFHELGPFFFMTNEGLLSWPINYRSSTVHILYSFIPISNYTKVVASPNLIALDTVSPWISTQAGIILANSFTYKHIRTHPSSFYKVEFPNKFFWMTWAYIKIHKNSSLILLLLSDLQGMLLTC